MNALVSIQGLWSADVSIGLTGHTRHRHKPVPVAAGFVAPSAVKSLTFSPLALAAAVARTATTRPGSLRLLGAIQKSALAELECLVLDGPIFELSSDLDDLADSERTHFASRCGAGITDLYMNALGYAWRANAACLAKTLDPHGDFLYDGGNVTGHGVVLAEARGSFAAKTSAKTITALAQRKYARQVKPYISKSSPFGQVVHGYSVAFGARPGATGAFLHLAETRIPKPKKVPKASPPPPVSPAGVTTLIALAAHRSNFFLMGALGVVDWIDWIDRMDGVSESPAKAAPVSFVRVPYAGRWYLTSRVLAWPVAPPPWWGDASWDPMISKLFAMESAQGLFPSPHGLFAMEETACMAFLDALSGILRGERQAKAHRIELPQFDPVGFRLGEESVGRGYDDGDAYDYALFRDGFALLGDVSKIRKVTIRRWSPNGGFEG